MKVLVVDDSALVRKLFGRVLADEADIQVAFARNGIECALAKARGVCRPDAHYTRRADAADERPFRPAWIESWSSGRVRVVMVSSLTSEGAEATLDALRLGAVDFVPKLHWRQQYRFGLTKSLRFSRRRFARQPLPGSPPVAGCRNACGTRPGEHLLRAAGSLRSITELTENPVEAAQGE